MSNFFTRLSYSLGNEDEETEHSALNIQPSDRVLCVTGSGDRPLHLLLKECREVVAIDANPIQNHLLRLKMSAIQHFDYERYISFLGLVDDHSHSRKEQLQALLHDMEPESAAFWRKNSLMVSKGVLYQGAMERYSRAMPILARLIQGRLVKKLFSFHDLEEQRAFVDKNWDTVLWRRCFDLMLSPKISRFILRDPGLYNHVDDSIRPGAHLYRRMNECLKQHLARDNYFVSLCLNGSVTRQASPPYLQKEASQVIRNRLDRITIKNANIIHFLETCPEKSFDAFSLSDVASYISEGDFKRLLQGVRRAAKPGARFCIREFLSRREMPIELQQSFIRDHVLEKRLEEKDRCFVYRFQAGHMS